MVAPAFGAAFVPARIRLVIAGGVALIIARWCLRPGRRTLLGGGTRHHRATGRYRRGAGLLHADRVRRGNPGGQLLANSMGLSFAYNLDPMHGAQTPVLGSSTRCWSR